jgi:predicted nuclease of restriction endonuclease-like (RecB) superfamily
MPIKDKAYHQWVGWLKEQIRLAQIKASVKVNTELINLYWQLGKELVQKESQSSWGDKWLHQLSKDLISEFPEMKGFSHTNLKYIRRWYLYYNSIIGQQTVARLATSNQKHEEEVATEIIQQVVGQIGQQPVDQIPDFLTKIPWGHHLQIITRCKNINEALFYIQETCSNNWSRAVLVHQVESGLYKRKGKAVTNFETTLPKPQSDLAKELLKNPYQFDFLSMGEEASERDVKMP